MKKKIDHMRQAKNLYLVLCIYNEDNAIIHAIKT